MSESDLGPVIGGVEPIKPIRKLFRLHKQARAGRAAASLAHGCTIGFVIVCGIVLALLMLWMLAGLATRTAASQEHHHQHHAFYQGWINLDGKGCCNDRDCAELRADEERERNGVLEVNIEGMAWCPILPRHYLRKGNVPNAAVSHACVIPQRVMPNASPCERLICYQPQPRS